MDWASRHPCFGFQSEEVIKATYQVTSHYAGTVPTNDFLKNHFKTHNLVFSILHHNKPIATDTVMSDTPAIDDGSTIAQFFCGYNTLDCDIYGIKNLKQLVNTPLPDNIHKCGAMTTLITDGGKYEVSKKVTYILHTLFISNMNLSPAINIRTSLRTDMVWSNAIPTPS